MQTLRNIWCNLRSLDAEERKAVVFVLMWLLMIAMLIAVSPVAAILVIASTAAAFVAAVKP